MLSFGIFNALDILIKSYTQGIIMTMDIEKDDDATREMLEMMGALDDPTDNTDELLNSLNDLETSSDQDDISTETDDLDGLLDDLGEDSGDLSDIDLTDDFELPDDLALPDDNSLQGEQLQAALSATAEIELPSESSIEEEEFDLNDLDMMEEGIEDSIENLPNTTTETEETVAETLVEDSLAELDDPELLFEVEESGNDLDSSSNLSQTNSLIDTMKESIEIDNDIHDIAKKVSQTAKQASALALEVTQQAQASTEQLQKTIQATFDATERAFEALKETQFEIDISTLNSDISEAEVSQKIQTIQAKNSQLKELNAKFMAQIDKLNKQ